MRYFYLLLILLFSLIVYAQVLNVSLNYPGNGVINTTSNDIKFNCSTTATINNITFYNNVSGQFIAVNTDNTGSNSVEFVVNDIPNGNYKWNCLATDSSNNKEFAPSNYTFTINLATTTFTCCINNQTWQEDTSLNNAFNLSVYFQNPTTYSVGGNSNINVNIMNNGFVNFSQPANWSGIETITFTSNGVSSNPIILNVSNINDPVYLLQDIPTQTITKNVNKTLNLDSYFSDPDSILTYTYTSLQHISIYINGNTITFTPGTDWTGTEYIVFTASDSIYNVSSNNVTLNVVNGTTINHQPQILNFYPLSIPDDIVVGSSYVFNISFYDEDNDILNVSWYLNNELVSSESSYNLSPQNNGDYNLTVYISDNLLSNSVTWIFNVGGSDIQAGGNVTASLCGNNQTDTGENCLNCPSDIKCKDNEICESGECVSVKDGNFMIILIYIMSAIGFLIFSFALISFIEKRRKSKIDKDVMEKARKHIIFSENTVENYIRKNLKLKVEEAVIKEKLLSVGWSLEEINKTFERIKNEGKPRTD